MSLPLLLLAACGSSQEPSANTEAEEFAARINAGSSPAPAVEPTPASVAPELEGAAAGAYEPGTATDPDAAICDATLMGPFLGREADDETRAAILQIAVNARDVRFVAPSPTYIKPDPTSARLNLMLDANNIIRDARCG